MKHNTKKEFLRSILYLVAPTPPQLKNQTLTLVPFSLSSQEVFTEMEEKYGEVEEMNVCDNLGDHLVGNVYVKVGEVTSS